jgi:hypothetical protein
MKKSELQQLVKEELQGVMQFLTQPNSAEREKWNQREPTEVPWEKAVASGDEKPAVIADPEKIAKIVAIARAAACKQPQMGMFENQQVRLNHISKGDVGKYKMYTQTSEGKIKKLDFIQKKNEGKPLTEELLQEFWKEAAVAAFLLLAPALGASRAEAQSAQKDAQTQKVDAQDEYPKWVDLDGERLHGKLFVLGVSPKTDPKNIESARRHARLNSVIKLLNQVAKEEGLGEEELAQKGRTIELESVKTVENKDGTIRAYVLISIKEEDASNNQIKSVNGIK